MADTGLEAMSDQAMSDQQNTSPAREAGPAAGSATGMSSLPQPRQGDEFEPTIVRGRE